MTKEFKLHEMLQRDTIEIAKLSLSNLQLMNDSNYPWFILVPRVTAVVDVYQLSESEQIQYLIESSQLSKILMELYQGKKMNIAALGNMCPQLHIHHIVRFENDIAWPNPVWGAFPAKPYSDDEITEIKKTVLKLLSD